MEIREYVAPLLKWWWLLLIAASVAAVSSYLAVRQQQQIYQARTTLMIGRTIENPNPTGNEFYLGQELAATYADVARRDIVREQTMAALGTTWLPEYNARRLPNTQVIEIVVTDTDRERARIVANELANQLVLQSPTAANPEEQERKAFIEEQLDELQTSIRATADDIVAKQEELNDLVSARQIRETQNQIDALDAKRRTLQSNYTSLLASTERGAINVLNIVDRASAYPVSSNQGMTVATAALIGFVLAAAAAYVLEYLDDTIKNPDQIEALTGVPAMAGITKIKGDKPKDKLISIVEPRAPVVEAFRTLRTAVQFANIDNPYRKLLITSSNPGDGKSTMVANLAVVMAQAGHRVLLIDADLRRPAQHQFFDLNKDNGLTSLLLSIDKDMEPTDKQVDEFLSRFAHTTHEPGLFVITSGPIPPNPSELLGSAKMKMILTALSSKFDFVVLDSPPCLAVSDAVVLGTQVDAVLLVADFGSTGRTQ
ncbi:MAG: polysaccharide biosynthesis tyrosine autokinase, partial [Chloroflexota bacterium]